MTDPFPTVRLRQAFEHLPAGAQGTLLDRYEQYNAATVEFFDPMRWVSSVPLDLLEQLDYE